MSAPSYKQLVEIIGAVAQTHPAVRSFACDERTSISLDGATNPIHVHLEQPMIKDLILPQGGSKSVRYQISLLVLDHVDSGNNDLVIGAISRCSMIGDWIVLMLAQHPPTMLRIEGAANTLSVRAFGGDLWTGVRLDFTLVTPVPMGAGDIKAFAP